MVARRGAGPEAGKARIGCLAMVLLVAAVVYLGRDVPGVFWRYYQLKDDVSSQASFAPGLTDDAIRERLVARSDSLGLPLGPKQWYIKRSHDEIVIRSEYDDSVVVQVLSWRHVFRFHFVPESRAEL